MRAARENVKKNDRHPVTVKSAQQKSKCEWPAHIGSVGPPGPLLLPDPPGGGG